MRDAPRPGPSDPTRRDFLLATGGTASAAAIAAWAPALADSAAAQGGSPAATPDGPTLASAVPITLRIKRASINNMCNVRLAGSGGGSHSSIHHGTPEG